MCRVSVLVPPFFFSLSCVALCRYTYHAGRDIVVLLFSLSFIYSSSLSPLSILSTSLVYVGELVYMYKVRNIAFIVY